MLQRTNVLAPGKLAHAGAIEMNILVSVTNALIAVAAQALAVAVVVAL